MGGDRHCLDAIGRVVAPDEQDRRRRHPVVVVVGDVSRPMCLGLVLKSVISIKVCLQ